MDLLHLGIVFFLLALTAVRLPVAEEVTLLLAAFFASLGTDARMLVFAAVMGITVADTINYLKGRAKSQSFKAFKEGQKFIARTGFFAVFTSRFFIASRAIMPYMAGAMRMPRLRYHFASLTSAVLLSTLLIVGGGWIALLLSALTSSVTSLWMSMLVLLNGVLAIISVHNQQMLKSH